MYLKHIPMDGPQNFRDIGGFIGKEGKAVAWNKLYRADSLSMLTGEDLRKLKERSIHTIVDLRSKSEQEESPDVTAEGIRWVSCPLMRDVMSSKENAADNIFARSMVTSYQNMLAEGSDLIARAVTETITGLQNGAVVFHCTAGKDRTGILAATLLLLLGVSREDIIADYQVSHTYNKNGVNKIIQERPELAKILEVAGEESMLHSHPNNIKAVLAVLNTENIGAWLIAAGVSEIQLQEFCRMMLED